MTNIFIALLCFMSMAVCAGENKDPNLALFQSVNCFYKQGYCEFNNFLGHSIEPEFSEMPKFVDFYTGSTGVNGITCNVWEAVCTNANSEVMGLNPNFKDDYGNSFSATPTTAEIPVAPTGVNPFNATFVQEDKVNSLGTVVITKYNVEMVVLADAVEVKGLLLNNNPKCIDLSPKAYMKKLSMGDRIKIRTGCRPVQIDVTTDSGSWVLRFQ